MDLGEESPDGAGAAPGIGSTAYTQNLDLRFPAICSSATSVGLRAAALVVLSLRPLDVDATGASTEVVLTVLSSVRARFKGGSVSSCVSSGAPSRVDRRSPRHWVHGSAGASRLPFAFKTAVRDDRRTPSGVDARRMRLPFETLSRRESSSSNSSSLASSS